MSKRTLNTSQDQERVILVHVNFPAGKMEEDLEEFKELTRSAGAEIQEVVTATRASPAPKYFVGTGKAAEISEIVSATQTELVIFNHVLSPAQERNLERLFKCRVLDRTGLILDIFAQRARSFEGKLQVELAQLKHLATRLVRGWTHLERQRGGIGLRGPGETQLESDRRLIRNRIKAITARLAKLRKQRQLARRARHKAIVPTVALVGYTNAGKSTLFNKLTGSSVFVANKLFATLDPTLRRVDFTETGPVIFADTVGFIRHLPHDLVEAFHGTLEEVSAADLLLHIVDIHDEQKEAHMKQVHTVLETIEAEHVPRLLVYNKIDLCPEIDDKIERDEFKKIRRVFISAQSGAGLPGLVQAVAEELGREMIECEVVLLPHQGKVRADLYKREAILTERIDDDGNYHLQVRIGKTELDKLLATKH